MFRNVMSSLIAVLAVATLSTAGNAMPRSYYTNLWEKYHYRHLYLTGTMLKSGSGGAGAIRSLSSCGARWYMSANGQCYPILN